MNHLLGQHGLSSIQVSPWSTLAPAAATAHRLHASPRPVGHGPVLPAALPTRVFLAAGHELDTFRALALPHVVLSGVALSRRPSDAPEDLQLLQRGDLVGLDALQRRAGERRIHALVDCELAPLRRMNDAEWRELLLHALLRRESQPGLASLRVGTVGERVRRMLLLLGDAVEGPAVLELPPLATIAAVTASTHETACRVVSHFRRTGLIEDAGPRRVRLMPGLQLSAGELPGGVTRSRTR
ncbi:hypothetical protein ACWA7J_08950 [Leptothrix sp. BB-4]